MKKYIILLAAALFAVATVCSARTMVASRSYFTITVGESFNWKPFGGQAASSIDVTGDAASVSQENCSLVVEGSELGRIEIVAERNGKAAIAEIKVVNEENRLPFTGNYNFRRPKDHYNIWVAQYDENGKMANTYVCARIGKDYVTKNYNFNGESWAFRYDDRSGVAYQSSNSKWDLFYGSEASSKVAYNEYDSNRRMLNGDDMNVMEDFEADFMKDFRREGNELAQLTSSYKGDEIFCGTRCWVFERNSTKYWVDSSNGMTLKKQNADGTFEQVIVYNLNYRAWGDEVDPM